MNGFVGPTPICTGIELSPELHPPQVHFIVEPDFQSFKNASNAPVTVISLIGHTEPAKTQLANFLVDFNTFPISEFTWMNDLQLPGPIPNLQAHYDSKLGCVYLNLSSVFDRVSFLDICSIMERLLKLPQHNTKNITEWLHHHQSTELVLMLHCFLLSHFVIIVQESSNVCYEWLEFFKLMNLIRTSLQENCSNDSIMEAILQGFNPTLFLALDVTTFLQNSNAAILIPQLKKHGKNKAQDSPQKSNSNHQQHSASEFGIKNELESRLKSISDLKKSVENMLKQLWKRKSSNSEQNPLFQFSNEQIVVPLILGPGPNDSLTESINLIQELNDLYTPDFSSSSFSTGNQTNRSTFLPQICSFNDIQDFPESTCGIQPFRKWIYQKTKQLQSVSVSASATFDPHDKKPKSSNTKNAQRKHTTLKYRKTDFHQGYIPRFLLNSNILPGVTEWFELSRYFIECVADVYSTWIDTTKILDPDTIYSMEFCQAALNVAKQFYLTNLPTSYGTGYHNKKLNMTLQIFDSQARGSCSNAFRLQLTSECVQLWQSSHRKCDAVSLTNHPCIHDFHVTKLSGSSTSSNSRDPTNDEDSSLTSSGKLNRLALTAAIIAADYRPSFSVVTPSIFLMPTVDSSTKQLLITPHSSGHVIKSRCNCGQTLKQRPDPFQFNEANVDFYIGLECCGGMKSLVSEILKRKQARLNSQLHVNEKHSQSSVQTEDTTHPGWDAIVLGSVTNLIKNSIGKNGNMCATIAGQSGFVDGYNTLFEWHVANRSQHTSQLRSNLSHLNQQEEQDFGLNEQTSTLNKNSLVIAKPSIDIKGYLGIEYECPAGHRLLLNAQLLASQSLSTFIIGKDQVSVQNLLDNANIPLFTVCTCVKRVAQLVRIYVGTPNHSSMRITFIPQILVLAKIRSSQLPSSTFGSYPHDETKDRKVKQNRKPNETSKTSKRQDDKPFNEEESLPPQKPESTQQQKSKRLDLGLDELLVLPPGELVCIRLPFIYSYREKPLIHGKLNENSECRFFLESHSFGISWT